MEKAWNSMEKPELNKQWASFFNHFLSDHLIGSKIIDDSQYLLSHPIIKSDWSFPVLQRLLLEIFSNVLNVWGLPPSHPPEAISIMFKRIVNTLLFPWHYLRRKLENETVCHRTCHRFTFLPHFPNKFEFLRIYL